MIVGTITTTSGGGQNTDDLTGGESIKRVCIGGCRFTETGDSYTRGWFVYAK